MKTIYWLIFIFFCLTTVFLLGLGSYLVQINNSNNSNEDKLNKIKKISVGMTVAGSICALIIIVFIVNKIYTSGLADD